MTKIKGTGVALVTPFKKDFSIDFDGLKKIVNHQCENGTDFLVIMGTTGENPVLNESETQQVIDTIKEANNHRLPLVLGIGGNNTFGVIDKLKNTNLDDYEAILSVSPYYNKPSQRGIINHFKMVADASAKPIILYNVPGRTSSNLNAETTLELAEHQNICAVKEASGNFSQCMEIINNRPEGFLVLSGDDAFTFPFISLGMDGVISVICNAYPKDFSQMVHFALENKTEEARKLHYKLLNCMNAIFDDGNPGGIKEVLNQLGLCDTTVRPPLANVNSAVKDKLVKIVKGLA